MSNRVILQELICKHNHLCYYCGCKVTTRCSAVYSNTDATVEHLIDKWSSKKHNKIDTPENRVLSCHGCNNTRGNTRNKIARNYYKSIAMKRGVNLNVSSTPSRELYKMFGAVPQKLFTMKGDENV